MTRVGDTVSFYVLTKHRCGGEDCACKPDLELPAKVVYMWPSEPDQPQALALDVTFPRDHVIDLVELTEQHSGEVITTELTRDGFIARQGHSPQSQAPVSGSWMPRPKK